MSLITLDAVDVSVGGPLLLENVGLSIGAGERIALIGRNGAGKSTLLRVLCGEQQPDDGQVRVADGARVARLEQEVPAGAEGSVFDVVSEGLGELGAVLAEYHRLAHADPVDTDALAAAQARIEAAGAWTLDQRVESTLDRLGLDGDAEFTRLSGGLKRRVLLARALVSGPDVLLLDEPTNHLDIAAIHWLEEFLRTWPGALVFVTHDRRFLRALATRIVEIDRGQATDWPGDWDNYLRRREERLNAEAQQNARFDKLLAQEKGYNTYYRMDDTECKAAKVWWKNNEEFWTVVRNEWQAVLSANSVVSLKPTVDDKMLHEHFAALWGDWKAKKVKSSELEGKVKELIAKFQLAKV